MQKHRRHRRQGVSASRTFGACPKSTRRSRVGSRRGFAQDDSKDVCQVLVVTTYYIFPKKISSFQCTYCNKICTAGTIIIIFQTVLFSFGKVLPVIHFHHPFHYNTNRQRKQSLPTFLCYNFSVKNNSKSPGLVLCLLDQSSTGSESPTMKSLIRW